MHSMSPSHTINHLKATPKIGPRIPPTIECYMVIHSTTTSTSSGNHWYTTSVALAQNVSQIGPKTDPN